MSKYDGEIRVGTSLDSKELEKGVSGLKAKLKTLTTNIGSSIKSGAKNLAANVQELASKAITTVKVGLAAATAAAIGFGKSAVSAFTEAEEAAAQLSKMLQNTGNSAKSIEHLMDTINEMSQGSVLSDSNLTAMSKQLATFDMTAEGIEQLLPALADMAIAEKGLNATMDDYVGIAQMMGKAVQGDVSGLSRMGFIIEKEVVEAIKTASTEEERLTMINEILGKTYSNLAVEMANSFAGQSQIAKNTFGKITESFGGATVETFLQPLLTKINETFGDIDWAELFGNDGVDGIINGLTVLFQKAFSVLPDIINSLNQYLNAFITAFGNAFATLDASALIDSIAGLLHTFVNAFFDVLIGTFDFLAKNGDQIIDALIDLALTIVDKLPQLVVALVTAITNNIDKLVDGFIQVVISLLTHLPEIILPLIEAVPKIIYAIVVALITNAPQLIIAAVECVTQLIIGFVQMLPKIKQFWQELPGKIVDIIIQKLPAIKEAGKNMVKGLWDGICAMGDWLKNKFNDFINGIIDAAKGALGIHSPSRVFAQIGEFTARGLGEGFGDQMSAVKQQIKDEMRGLIAASQASTLGLGLAGAGASYNQSNVFNFNVPAASPYEIERAMRQAQMIR